MINASLNIIDIQSSFDKSVLTTLMETLSVLIVALPHFCMCGGGGGKKFKGFSGGIF